MMVGVWFAGSFPLIKLTNNFAWFVIKFHTTL